MWRATAKMVTRFFTLSIGLLLSQKLFQQALTGCAEGNREFLTYSAKQNTRQAARLISMELIDSKPPQITISGPD